MTSRRLVKSKSGLKMVCQHGHESAPWDMEEPHWLEDSKVTQCPTCNSKFDFIHRRHHCRRCGYIFCGKCCSVKVQFYRMGFVDPVRHCVNCAAVTRDEEDFFLNHIKVLFTGAPFHIATGAFPASSPSADHSPTSNGESVSTLYYCKLSSDQRSLIFDPFESDVGSMKSGSNDFRSEVQPIEINKVQFIEIISTPEEDKKGLSSILTLHVKVPGESDLTWLRLTSPPEPSKKPSVQFIAALQKGLTMAIEYRKSSQIDVGEEAEAN